MARFPKPFFRTAGNAWFVRQHRSPDTYRWYKTGHQAGAPAASSA